MVRSTRYLLNLAFSHIDWLPTTSSSSSASLRSLCDQAKVSKLAFLRHGKTGPKPDGGIDFDRFLTDLGQNQAKEAGSSFGRQLAPFYSQALVSPAPRTVETAELFLESANQKCHIQTSQVLYDGTMQPEGSVLFQKIGYAPLSDYVDSEDQNDRAVSRKVLGEYSSAAIDAISETLKTGAGQQEDSTLLVVGHAIYLPAAALGVASLVDCQPEGLETILSCNTQEAEGYLIDLESSQATYLSRPSSLV
ncbi:expressed unknown protein [Seminavis robusta]|uniref:Serine/threonine-protein phosphatase PGAM5, mitochondrial n=1 Tax=Seminavis robusta TaxID=568900 RepID=A0A9N8DS85_9STRA|nr:expressed unknown protein [Seminavis robusta]|eukprot:Sro251_g099160.1 n/a (249) ;mRNA; f:13552-14298